MGGWLLIVSGAGLHAGQALLAFGGCLSASAQPLAAPLAQTICPRMPLYLRLRVSVIMRCERVDFRFVRVVCPLAS